MVKIILRQEAIDDLNDIWKYTKTQWSESQADKYYQTIKLSCKLIAENPNIGKTHNKISSNLLGLKTGNHIIFYSILKGEEIEIIRILHERMDLISRLSE
jgi:toxin ParE1/3/4